MTFQSLIAAGNFDHVNGDITEERFPLPKNMVLGSDPRIFRFKDNPPLQYAQTKMAEEGYYPATFWDLLDFAAKRPEALEYEGSAIEARGTVVEIDVYLWIPAIHRDGGGRKLDLGPIAEVGANLQEERIGLYRQLAVRK